VVVDVVVTIIIIIIMSVTMMASASMAMMTSVATMTSAAGRDVDYIGRQVLIWLRSEIVGRGNWSGRIDNRRVV
jgi:hypothetical protein